MSYIDVKYLNLISPMLPLFKKKGDNLWNFRCPYCGGTHKSLAQGTEGYVFRRKADLFYKCHNCGAGATLANLIKHVDSKTYDDYILERYRDGGTVTVLLFPNRSLSSMKFLRRIFSNHFDPFRN